MPFLRFARDKRGYEHTYLVHAPIRRGKPGPSRVLYWYRTPPGVKVGRPAFDQEARSAIEQNNPGVTFDWKALEATPMPPVPEAERWREKRRQERMAKQARRTEKADDSPGLTADDLGQEEESPELAETLLAEAPLVERDLDAPQDQDLGDEAAGKDLLQAAAIVADGAPVEGPTGVAPGRSARRRRRRGGRRHGRREPGSAVGTESATSADLPDSPTDPSDPRDLTDADSASEEPLESAD